MLFNLDPAKLLVILVVALVVLGPDRLPRVARQLGAAWRELTNVRERVQQEISAAIPDLGLPAVPRVSGAVSRFINDLARPPDPAAAATNTEAGAAGEPVALVSEEPAEDGPVGTVRRNGGLPARRPAVIDAGFVFDDPSMN